MTNDKATRVPDTYVEIPKEPTQGRAIFDPKAEQNLRTRPEPKFGYLDVKKGDKVFLLEPLWDNVQYFRADEIISWPYDHPPSTRQACLPDDVPSALTAPAMGDGTPPDGYIDPRSDQPLAKPEYRF